MAHQSDSETPQTSLADLVEILRQDAQLRARHIEQLGHSIAGREIPPSLARTADEGSGEAMEKRFQVEREHSRRAKWYSGLSALLSILVGAVLFYLVVSMASSMNRMEDYMYNMGHSANDDRPADRKERKTAGRSYIDDMAENMRTMREDMAAMRMAMDRMTGNVGLMSGDMRQMTEDMAGMRVDMQTLTRDLGTLNITLGLMRQDTATMRIGVGGMSEDTRAMGVPFRVMDSMMPWR